jgi:putative ABC transport system ATP-binding protein
MPPLNTPHSSPDAMANSQASAGSKTVLQAKQLCKVYTSSAASQEAVKQVNLTLFPGDFVALMGPSGCGKSTLLNLIGAMDTPTSGELLFCGERMNDWNDDRQTLYRRQDIGFVFQFFNLIEHLTALENILLPLQLSGKYNKQAWTLMGQEWLERVGLSQKGNLYPYQLSGGEAQRVAIARALIHQPKLLLADEPTGNLDSQNGQQILELLQRLNRDAGFTILMVTHSREAARIAKTLPPMRDGSFEPVTGT